MTKVILLTVLVAGTVAQVFPSCSQATVTVIGWVEAKYSHAAAAEQYIIVVNSVEYGVPYNFWYQVKVGDLVKFENGIWTIVRKAGT